mmetsp:Transcript_48177/g.83980  ORF Transcript_48177/g.83980 Transcript_48177/m.83980 type:complete len:104 (+) Transcript_48177:2-313(+)
MRFKDHACAEAALEACLRESVTLEDARGETWVLCANWAHKTIPEDAADQDVDIETMLSTGVPAQHGALNSRSLAAEMQARATANQTTRCRRKRVPPTGLSRHA